MSVSISEIQPQVPGLHDKDIAFFFDDPGAKDFFEPVLPYLAADSTLRTRVVLDGYSKKPENIVTNVELRSVDIDSQDDFNPALIVAGVSASACSYRRFIDLFPYTSTVLAEDYYHASDGYFDRHLLADEPLPDRIFAIDEIAKQEIIRRNGTSIIDLASRVEVTGHPGLDYLANRDCIETERKNARKLLGVTDEDILVSCFATIDVTDLVKQFAEELRGSRKNLKIAFNPHPRDTKQNTTLYDTFLKDAGVARCDTGRLNYRQMIAAADAVAVLPHSTLSLHALGHGIPTFHIDNTERLPDDLQIPVQYGLSQLVSPAEFSSYMRSFSKEEHEVSTLPRNAAQAVACRIGDLARSLSVGVG